MMGVLIAGGLLAAGGVIAYSLYRTLIAPQENTSVSVYGWIAIILALIMIIGFLLVVGR